MGAFFDAYFPHIYGLVFRLLGHEAAAEDAAQEVFLKVHRAIGRLDPERDPGPWLTTIAYNVCRDRWRSSADKMSRQSSSLEHQPELANRLTHPDESPEDSVLRSERASLVRRALDQLPEQQREVVLLHDYEGFTHDEVATMIGATHAAVRKRYSRALASLGVVLKDWLDGPAS